MKKQNTMQTSNITAAHWRDGRDKDSDTRHMP